jgi:hypothetical protein
MAIAGWLHRQQGAVIEHLNAENRLLRKRLGDQRIIFAHAERRNLAEKARAVGRKTLRELGTVVTPEILFRWYRELETVNGPSFSVSHRASRAPARNLWLWWANGKREPQLGLHAHPGRDGEPWAYAGPRDESQDLLRESLGDTSVEQLREHAARIPERTDQHRMRAAPRHLITAMTKTVSRRAGYATSTEMDFRSKQ